MSRRRVVGQRAVELHGARGVRGASPSPREMRSALRSVVRPRAARLFLAALSLLVGVAPVGAQESARDSVLPSAPARRTIVAVNPIGLVAGIASGEIERVMSPSVGLSAGATRWSLMSGRILSYTSVDARLRYYVSGTAPTGVSFGVVAGMTHAASDVAGESVDAIGTGVEISYGELAGRDKRLFLAVGAGAKRLFLLRQEVDGFRFAYPTARVAVGWAF